MKTLLLALLTTMLFACKPSQNLYVQKVVKTESGFKKIGQPAPHKILLGDTINFVYKRF